MNGVLIVNKPKGLTSHDIVDIIRRKFKLRKVGHAGTLDPMATGLLIILIGSATKFSNLLVKGDKEYYVKCLLGVRTDTDDLDGKIEQKITNLNISREDIEKALLKFKGKIKQKVPSYSAVKVKGEKLYKLARSGKNFKLPEKEVIISEIELLDFKKDKVSLRITCSKGTYIRSICRDLGEILGCGGCVSKLIRTKAYPFSLDEAFELKKIREINAFELSKLLKSREDYENL